MKDKIFLDSNILIYSFDKSDKVKQKISLDLTNQLVFNDNIYISTQVIQEFYINATQKIKEKIPSAEAKEFIKCLKTSNVYINDTDTIIQSIDIQKKYRLSFWDSLIISSALSLNCNFLYSEDLQDGLVIDGKMIVKNPFNRIG